MNDGRPVASSGPGTEHSVMTAWPSERAAMHHTIQTYGQVPIHLKLTSLNVKLHDVNMGRACRATRCRGNVSLLKEADGTCWTTNLHALDRLNLTAYFFRKLLFKGFCNITLWAWLSIPARQCVILVKVYALKGRKYMRLEDDSSFQGLTQGNIMQDWISSMTKRKLRCFHCLWKFHQHYPPWNLAAGNIFYCDGQLWLCKGNSSCVPKTSINSDHLGKRSP